MVLKGKVIVAVANAEKFNVTAYGAELDENKETGAGVDVVPSSTVVVEIPVSVDSSMTQPCVRTSTKFSCPLRFALAMLVISDTSSMPLHDLKASTLAPLH